MLKNFIKSHIIDEAKEDPIIVPKEEKPKEYEQADLFEEVPVIPTAKELYDRTLLFNKERQEEFMKKKLNGLDKFLVDLTNKDAGSKSFESHSFEYRRIEFTICRTDEEIIVDTFTYDFSEGLKKYKDAGYSISVYEMIFYTGLPCVRRVVLDWFNPDKQYARIFVYPEPGVNYMKIYMDYFHEHYGYEFFNNKKDSLIIPLWEDVPMIASKGEREA